MQQVSYKTHLAQTQLSQGKLIKQHYQGGAVFQVAKSSLLIPIPGFTRFCTCVCNNCLYCTMGHKKNPKKQFDVLVCSAPFFHGNPAGHVHNEKGSDESPELRPLSRMTMWAERAWTSDSAKEVTKSPSQEQSGDRAEVRGLRTAIKIL